MSQSSMKELLEAGVHFGHQSKRWNPKMKPYIFTARNGVHVIDLAKTVPLLDLAFEFVKETVANGGQIIFVGTKKQARHIIKEEAERTGALFITERWMGGLLTNFDSIKKSLRKLETLKAQREAGELKKFTKKEQALIDHEIARLERLLGGIAELRQLPQAIFVVDPHKEDNAVAEANQMGIPVVAVVDTNCDPSKVDYPIPGNDDALKSIKLFVSAIANAVAEGRELAKDRQPAKDETEAGDAGKTVARNEPTISQDAQPAAAKEAKDVPPAGAKAKRSAAEAAAGNSEVENIVEPGLDMIPSPSEAATEEALKTEQKPKKSADKTKAASATTKVSTTDK